MSGFSFKLTKTLEKKVLQDSQIRDDSTKDNDEGTDFIKDVSDNKITGTIVQKTNEDLVIPLIAKNKWRDRDKILPDDDEVNSKPKERRRKEELLEKDEKELSIEERAARELILESRKQLQDWRDGDTGPEIDEVPLLLSNAVPKGFETEENLDVSLRAEQSTLDDYESIPVEKYGLAMLRGMGWKPDEGIGGFKKQVVKTIDPVMRPKGLGLGATKPKKEKEVLKEGEEALVLRKGAFVLIESGKKAGLYGEVEGLDEENARVVVKLALGNEKVSVSENIIKLVNKKEYKDWGKIVNKEKFTKFKAEQDEKAEVESRARADRRSSSPEAEVVQRKRRSRSRDRGRSTSPDIKRVKTEKRTWVRPDIKVRCIDKKFKDGRYFNEKMTVIDVVTNSRCDCRTDEGKILQGVRTDRLETVIPRELGGRVQILAGDYKGEIAELLDKDKARCRANVRLLISQKVVMKSYEDICSFVGDPGDFD